MLHGSVGAGGRLRALLKISEMDLPSRAYVVPKPTFTGMVEVTNEIHLFLIGVNQQRRLVQYFVGHRWLGVIVDVQEPFEGARKI